MEQYGEVPLDRALEILAQIAAALDSVHRKQIVHRDLKPENIMVTSTDDKVAHVVVLDFGIAKLSEASLPNAVKTAVPMAMGTRGYWSPEQARGDRVDTRSDIFSLGVIAYEMLTGTLPDGSNDDPRRHERGRHVSAAWADAIRAALAFDPAQRPQTVRELIRPLIDSVDRGPELAALAAPSLFRSATADDMTMKHAGDVPVAGAVRTPPPPTTLRGGAGARRATAVPGWRRRWVIGAGLLCLIGAGVVCLIGVGGLLSKSMGSRRDKEAERKAEPREALEPRTTQSAPLAERPRSPDAGIIGAGAPPGCKIALTVRSEPVGALVFVDDDTQPRGATPITLRVTPDGTIRLRGKLAAHTDALMDITPTKSDEIVTLRLRRAAKAPRRRRRTSKPVDSRRRKPELFPGDVGGAN